jgi:hypothetical protein
MAKEKKRKRKRDRDGREFPTEIHVAFDNNSKYDHPDLTAYRAESEAVDGDGPTRVATYKLFREGVFRKQTVEE